MRTFVEKSEAIQRATSPTARRRNRSRVGHNHGANSILQLQNTIGNQAVQMLLRSNAEEGNAVFSAANSPHFDHEFYRSPVRPHTVDGLQTKLAISGPEDKYEQEARRVAEYVMRIPKPQIRRAYPCGEGCPKCQTEQPGLGHDSLQTNRTLTSDAVKNAAPPIVQAVLASPCKRLDSATRTFMETRFGRSFSKVRVHTDDRAAESAHAICARAYTVGNHIVFGEKASMQSSSGRQLLAHELAHTIQQGDQPIPSKPIPIIPENSGAERRTRAAERGVAPAPMPPNAHSPVLQRDVLGAVGEAITQPFENMRSPLDLIALPLAITFDGVVIWNIAVASAISIPANWCSIVLEYAAANPLDGAILVPAMARLASFWRGGWIMSLQPDADAMTLDDDIFVSGNLSLSTYVHELVHVLQYTLLGKVGFLESYFGLSGATIAYRWATGQPLNVMRSNPHEEQAYNLQARFNSWYSTNKGGSARSVTV